MNRNMKKILSVLMMIALLAAAFLVTRPAVAVEVTDAPSGTEETSDATEEPSTEAPSTTAPTEPTESTEPSYRVTVVNGWSYDNYGRSVTTAKEGDTLLLYFNKSRVPAGHVIDAWTVTNLRTNEKTVLSPADDHKDSYGYYYTIFIMPGADVRLEASFREGSTEQESSSEEPSESESESGTADESGAESGSEDPSESESESESSFEDTHMYVGDYILTTDLSGLDVPEGLILAYDTTTFNKVVQTYYNTNYGVYVYYATIYDEPGLFLYNKPKDSMMPYAVISTDADSYLVSSALSYNDVPGEFQSEKSLNIGNLVGGSTLFVPCYRVLDVNGKTVTLLYLIGQNSMRKGFYVYDQTETGGVQLLRWQDYERAQISESDAPTETEPPTDPPTEATKPTARPTEPPTTAAPETVPEPTQSTLERALKFINRYAVWFTAIGAVVLLLIISLILVAYFNREQEEEEEGLDLPDDDDGPDGRSGYSQSTGKYARPGRDTEVEDPYVRTVQEADEDPFNISFGFPEEVGTSYSVSGKVRPEGNRPAAQSDQFRVDVRPMQDSTVAPGYRRQRTQRLPDEETLRRQATQEIPVVPETILVTDQSGRPKLKKTQNDAVIGEDAFEPLNPDQRF